MKPLFHYYDAGWSVACQDWKVSLEDLLSNARKHNHPHYVEWLS
jgi:hypothetical protein